MHKITIRVPPEFYQKLNALVGRSNCRTVTEAARSILFREKIICYEKNIELDSVAIELSLARKELNAIGRNINQITRHFHAADPVGQKLFQATRAGEQYARVGEKVMVLTSLIERVLTKWLPK